MHQMIVTEENMTEITSLLGIPLEQLRNAQQEDEEYGPILAFLHYEVLPDNEDDARYIVIVSQYI